MRLAAHAVHYLGFEPHRINILTFYNAQRDLLEKLAKREGIAVPVLSVDSMQGREADVILLSCVRADPAGGLGFVADPRRVNVALSRARESLIVVGSKQCLEVERIWNSSIKNLQRFMGPNECIKETEATIPRGWGAPRVISPERDRRRERSSVDREFEEDLPPAAPVVERLEQRDSGSPDDWDASSDDDDAATVAVAAGASPGTMEPPAAQDDSDDNDGDGGGGAGGGERFSQTSESSVALGVS